MHIVCIGKSSAKKRKLASQPIRPVRETCQSQHLKKCQHSPIGEIARRKIDLWSVRV